MTEPTSRPLAGRPAEIAAGLIAGLLAVLAAVHVDHELVAAIGVLLAPLPLIVSTIIDRRSELGDPGLPTAGTIAINPANEQHGLDHGQEANELERGGVMPEQPSPAPE